MKREKCVLIIGYVWVEPRSSAAGSRMLQLIEQFSTAGYHVVFSSPAQKGVRAADLSLFKVEEVEIQLNHSSFDIFVKDLSPEVVIFDRFMIEEQFGWRVAEHCPQALRVLDTEDLHSLRKERQHCIKKGEPFTPEHLLESDTARREIASILRCDLSLIISSYEIALLKNLFEIDPELLFHLPLMLERIGESHIDALPSFEQRANFVFIGNFLHAPNVDAALELKTKWWPMIRKELPEAELHLYGAYPTQQILQLNKPSEGFLVKGPVEEAEEVVKSARVLLAPIRFGAGIKGKLTEAMICGTPSVTTTIGAEGMHAELPWAGIVSNNEFSQSAVRLYQEKRLWEESQENGVRIINELYDKEKLGKGFLEKVTSLQQNLKNHRRKNFLGNLLQQQGLQATKYMALWIEAKNR